MPCPNQRSITSDPRLINMAPCPATPNMQPCPCLPNKAPCPCQTYMAPWPHLPSRIPWPHMPNMLLHPNHGTERNHRITICLVGPFVSTLVVMQQRQLQRDALAGRKCASQPWTKFFIFKEINQTNLSALYVFDKETVWPPFYLPCTKMTLNMSSSVTNVVLVLVSTQCLLCYMQMMLSFYRIRVPGYRKHWMLYKIIQIVWS